MKKKTNTQKEKPNKPTISRDELLRMSQDLCYEYYCTKFEEFITNRELSNCVDLEPYDRDRLKEQFKEFMKYEKFEASVEWIKEYYEYYLSRTELWQIF